MQTYLVIAGGQVVNRVQADADFAASQGWIQGSGQIGDIYDPQAKTFTTPAPPADQMRLATIDDAIASDATVASLKAMTAGQFDAWWSANVTTLGQANNVLQRLARIVLRRMT